MTSLIVALFIGLNWFGAQYDDGSRFACEEYAFHWFEPWYWADNWYESYGEVELTNGSESIFAPVHFSHLQPPGDAESPPITFYYLSDYKIVGGGYWWVKGGWISSGNGDRTPMTFRDWPMDACYQINLPFIQ